MNCELEDISDEINGITNVITDSKNTTFLTDIFHTNVYPSIYNKKEICNINNDSSNILHDIISFYKSGELKDKLIKDKLIKDINTEFVQNFTNLKNFDINIDNKWNQIKEELYNNFTKYYDNLSTELVIALIFKYTNSNVEKSYNVVFNFTTN